MTASGPVAITGATGFVGQAVLDEADRRGLAVRALARRDMAAREGVEWLRGDLQDAAALARLVEGASAVLHIAGVVSSHDKAGFHAGNVEGTANVIAAAQGSGVQCFVAVSSLSAREPGLSDYGASKREAELLVEASGLDWTLVRPPAIYGPRDTEMFDLFRAARMGVVPMPPAGRASVIHVDDLARLLLDCLASDMARHAVFEPDDGRAGGWPHGDLARAIGHAVGKRVWAPAMPAALVKLAARADVLVRGNKARLTPDRAQYMVHPDWACHADKAVPAALWKPRIDTPEGLAQTAAWYAAEGWIAKN
ncbi:NAD(P)H-binding protein [Altererythrobacter sp. KTW20L]|uniref:NAD-dependent epimerase/dehydratase family protein n=1 Tax=Altererythrobacter sp. KTW20L TaxID=2942210 RepID=UPI0020BF06AA|nr:NAD(P)H-binding protein [Altererythrobacter sp. KTW20L]